MTGEVLVLSDHILSVPTGKMSSCLVLSCAFHLRWVQAMINGIGIVGFRDPHGIRPLVFGSREKSKIPDATKDFVLSSESVVMDMLCFDLLREFCII